MDGGDGVFNEVFGCLGGLVGLAGQVAHLVGHNGKALTGAAGPGGFHSGVQRQNIGLESDILNCGNDLADLFRRAGDIAHSHVKLLDVIVADRNLLAGLTHAGAGLLGGSGSLLGAGGDVVDRGGKLLHSAGLLGSALSQGLGAVGHLLGTSGYLAGRLRDIGDYIAHVGDKLIDAGLNGRQIAGEGGGQFHIKVALGHLTGGAGDILNHAVENPLAGTQSVAHFAQLILAGEADGDAQIALAEAHQCGADLIAGLGNASDDLDGHYHHNDGGDNHDRNNGENANRGGGILLLDDFFLSGLELRGQTVTGSGGSGQLGRAAFGNHGHCALAVGAGHLDNLRSFCAPLLHGVDEGIQDRLVIHGESIIELCDHRLQLVHFAGGGIQITHFAGKHSVPQAPGGNIIIDAALGNQLIGLYIMIDNILISSLLGAHHHQRGDNDNQRDQDCCTKSYD